MSATGHRIGSEIIIAPLTPLGHWFVDAATSLPIGDPLLRSARVAVVFAVIAVALLAAIVARFGHARWIAAAVAVVAALQPPVWTRLTTAPAESLAACAALGAAVMLAAARRGRRAPLVCAIVFATVSVAVAPGAAALTVIAAVAAVLLAYITDAAPIGTSGKAVLLGALLFALTMDRVNAPASETWRLAAWRDAVERALPQGTIVVTSERSVAARLAPVFKSRPAGIDIAYAPVAEAASATFVLDDVQRRLGSDAAGFRRVALTLAGPDEFLAHVPSRTIVAVAVSQVVAAQLPGALDRTLQMIGRTRSQPTRAFVTAGVLRESTAPSEITSSTLQLLIGDVIPGTMQRSPTDVELLAGTHEATIRVRGRELITGAAWAVVLVSPHGPILHAFSGPDAATRVPASVPEGAVWQRTP